MEEVGGEGGRGTCLTMDKMAEDIRVGGAYGCEHILAAVVSNVITLKRRPFMNLEHSSGDIFKDNEF